MKGFSAQVAYLERERNFLPWTIVMEPFRIILDLLEPRETDISDYRGSEYLSPDSVEEEKEEDYHKTPDLIDDETRGEVRERFKTWVIHLMMPYFYDNGFNDDPDATEEEKHLKEKMREFACRRLEHQPCLRWEDKQPMMMIKPLSDEEYCDKMLPKIVHQSNVNIDVALDVLERCPDQVMSSQNREEFMGKLTSKVGTKKEVKRLAKWEAKHKDPCSPEKLPPGIACYGGNALEWAKESIEQAYKKSEARENCRDMVFHTIKKIFV